MPIFSSRAKRGSCADTNLEPAGHVGYKLARLSAYWLFPGIVISAVLSNQPFDISMVLGQVAALVNDLAAVLILLGSVRRRWWIGLLVVCILVAKALRVVSGSGASELAYIGLLNLVFCLAGAVVVFQRPTLAYKQVMVICLLNFVVMVLQVTGVGAWTQLLTTHGEGNLTEPVSTLFVKEDRLDYLLVQGRPAGISYSNVILSLIIMFGFVLHFSRRKGALWWGTVLLSGVAVLCMAKIAMVGLLLTVLVVLVLGNRQQKIRVWKAAGLFVGFLGLYAVLFPGLLSRNLSSYTVGNSFFYRANDIMAALNPDLALREMRKPYFEGTRQFSALEEGEFVSGYASLVASSYSRMVPIAAVLAMGIGIFVLGFRRLKRRFPGLTLKIILTIVVIGAFPATHPIWAAPAYWFMAGFGVLPLVYMLRPRFIERA